MNYTAQNIKILSSDEINFMYSEKVRISEEYSKPEEYVHRLLEAAILFGKDIKWAEDRYCKSVEPRCKEFSAFYREYLKDRV